MATQWRLKQFLNDHGIKPAVVARMTQGRLSRNSVYALVRSAEAVRFDTLDVLLPALQEITGEEVAVSDLISYEPDPAPTEDEEALLASGVGGLGEALDDLESDLPPGEVDAWLETFYSAAAENAG